ncbi:hypothetical protein DAI22_10g016201 [Oryza sativa Japonica Group]|nr:hypothetical protein DAI22_10g016201 [Oryza sativa Japonica Group]
MNKTRQPDGEPDIPGPLHRRRATAAARRLRGRRRGRRLRMQYNEDRKPPEMRRAAPWAVPRRPGPSPRQGGNRDAAVRRLKASPVSTCWAHPPLSPFFHKRYFIWYTYN